MYIINENKHERSNEWTCASTHFFKWVDAFAYWVNLSLSSSWQTKVDKMGNEQIKMKLKCCDKLSEIRLIAWVKQTQYLLHGISSKLMYK